MRWISAFAVVLFLAFPTSVYAFCSKDNQCPEQMICDENRCIDKGYLQACPFGKPCEEGRTCSDNFCRKGNPELRIIPPPKENHHWNVPETDSGLASRLALSARYGYHLKGKTWRKIKTFEPFICIFDCHTKTYHIPKWLDGPFQSAHSFGLSVTLDALDWLVAGGEIGYMLIRYGENGWDNSDNILTLRGIIRAELKRPWLLLTPYAQLEIGMPIDINCAKTGEYTHAHSIGYLHTYRASLGLSRRIGRFELYAEAGGDLLLNLVEENNVGRLTMPTLSLATGGGIRLRF